MNEGKLLREVLRSDLLPSVQLEGFLEAFGGAFEVDGKDRTVVDP